jgi:hypothetical protein
VDGWLITPQACKAIRGYRAAAVKAPERLGSCWTTKSASDGLVWLTEDCATSETYMLHVEEVNTFYTGVALIIMILHQEVFANALVPRQAMEICLERT